MSCRAALLLVALAAGSACGGTDLVLPTGTPAAIDLNAGDDQTAAAGTAVAVRPSAVVRDDDGNPVRGAPITFSVKAGGGSVTGASQTTGADGVATVGSWTLGTTPGPNRLEASVTADGPVSGNPVVFSATAIPGPASPTESVAEVPANVFLLAPAPIVVATRDQFGNPLGRGGDDVDVTVLLNGGRTPLAVTDNGNGTYTASTDDVGLGSFQVEVTLNGAAVKGSPFPMRVRLF